MFRAPAVVAVLLVGCGSTAGGAPAVTSDASPPAPDASTDPAGVFSFSADACTPRRRHFALGLGSVDVVVLGRTDDLCRFRYEDEMEGGYAVYGCGVATGVVRVSTAGRQEGADLSFDLARDCTLERTGSLFQDMAAGLPPAVEEGTTVDGKRQGLWTTYIANPGGQRVRMSTATYKDGLLHGEAVTTYMADGVTPIYHGVYRQGLKHGRWVEDSIFGHVRDEEGDYDRDQRTGKWIEHGHQGQVIASTMYRKGKKHGPYKAWYERGGLRHEGGYADDQKHGVWNTWNESGVLLEEEGFVRGKPHGRHIRWSYATNVIVLAEHHANGLLEGRSSRWNAVGDLIVEVCYEHGRILRQKSFDVVSTPVAKRNLPTPADADLPCR